MDFKTQFENLDIKVTKFKHIKKYIKQIWLLQKFD
jgi:hypothetical protein